MMQCQQLIRRGRFVTDSIYLRTLEILQYRIMIHLAYQPRAATSSAFVLNLAHP